MKKRLKRLFCFLFGHDWLRHSADWDKCYRCHRFERHTV